MTSYSAIYTSELASSALRLAPTGSPYRGQATSCAMCQRPISDGQLCEPLSPSKMFTDWLALSPSRHICGWCAVTSVQAHMRPLQRSVICSDGVYPIGKDDYRAWFLLTPPEPPYAVVVSTGAPTSVLHLHWRTPVTLSNELVVLRIDEMITSIRRPVLQAALLACEEMARLMLEARPAGFKGAPRSSPPRHPFVALDRGLSDPGHGRLRDDAIEISRRHGRQDLVITLQQLSPGELWALATLAKAKTATPTRPVAITSPKQATSSTEEPMVV